MIRHAYHEPLLTSFTSSVSEGHPGISNYCLAAPASRPLARVGINLLFIVPTPRLKVPSVMTVGTKPSYTFSPDLRSPITSVISWKLRYLAFPSNVGEVESNIPTNSPYLLNTPPPLIPLVTGASI